MLPYFGNTSDEEDIDENVPLSVKLEQIAKHTNSSYSVSNNKKQCDGTIKTNFSGNIMDKPLSLKKRGRKPKGHNSDSRTNCERKITRSSGLPLDGAIPFDGNKGLRKRARKSSVISPENKILLSSKLNIDDSRKLIETDNNTSTLVNIEKENVQSTPPKKRGRPKKIKLTSTEIDISENMVERHNAIESETGCLNQGNECEILKSLPDNQVFETEPNTDLVESKDHSEDLDSLSGVVAGTQDSPRLELRDLDTAIQKSIALKRNKSIKSNLQAPADGMSENGINKKQPIKDNNSLGLQPCFAVDVNAQQHEELLIRKSPLKSLGKRNKQSQSNAIITKQDDSSGLATREFSELREATYDSPRLMTRLRKQKLNTPDSQTTNKEVSSKSNTHVDDNDESNTVHTEIGLNREIPDCKVDSIISKDANNILESNKAPDVTELQSEAYTNDLKNVLPCKSNGEILEDTKNKEGKKEKIKRGRKRKCKNHLKSLSCNETSLKNVEIDSVYDSEVEINIPLVTNFLHSVPSIENSVNDNSDEKIDSRPKGSNKSIKSKKRKHGLNETEQKDLILLESESCKNNVQNNEDIHAGDENISKKLKCEARMPGNDCNNSNDVTQHSDYQSSSKEESEKRLSAIESSNNRAFLWSKISGFLNKSTRSVGTQVKVKNMMLKGVETSEPEVSLQSELTLPLVIKTLFEELKTLDSSFTNP